MVAKSLRLGFSCLCFMALTGCSSQMFSASPAVPEPAKPAAALPMTLSQQPQPTKIALLIPLSGGLENAGKAIKAGFDASYASSSFHPAVAVYDTSQGDITSIYQKAIQDGANYVVGPLDKSKVTELEKSGQVRVNTIALNDADGNNIVPHLFQFPLSPTDEAQQVANKAAAAGYRTAILITPSGSWGETIAQSLRAQWQHDGGVVSQSLSVNNDENLKEKIQGLTAHADVIFLVARPSLAREINPLLPNTIPVYGTSLIYTGLLDSAKDKNLNGIKFGDEPLVIDQDGRWSMVRQQLTLSQPVFVQQYIRLYGLGYDAAQLTQNLSALNSGINGATGQLSLGSDQHIVRKLSWAIFQKGIPTEVN
ncbi:MAG: penicillin-binding protein activator [Gammaproteobacteria bacterium]|nr:penicillin-binding protein activator [Gammaproteobacteria bacterium]